MKKLLLFLIAVTTWSQCWCQSFVNASMETWGDSALCEINIPPDGWSNYSNGGIGPDEGRLTMCPSTIPPVASDGNTYARMMAGTPVQGEGMYQLVSGFIIGNSYTIRYDYCGSNLWGGNADCVWHLFLDDVDVNQSSVFSSADSVWATNYFTFTATMAMHKIGVRAYTPTFGSPGSAAIDNFIITESKPTGIEDDVTTKDILVFPNPVRNEITIYHLRFTILKFEIYDISGRSICQRLADNNQKKVIADVANLRKGIYFAEVFFNNGSVKRIKFIKE